MIPVVSHPAYSFEFPVWHRFPMEKFRLLADYVHEKGIATDTNLFRPGRMSR